MTTTTLNPTMQTTGFRCQSCDRPFRRPLPVQVPMEVFLKAMAAVRCPLCSGRNLTMGEGRRPAEDDAIVGPLDALYDERVAAWRERGEHGQSSMAIFEFMTLGAPRTADAATPRDLDDLRRCALVLRRFPRWVARLPEMASLSPAWKALAPELGRLIALFEQEAGPDYRDTAPSAYEMLRRLQV